MIATSSALLPVFRLKPGLTHLKSDAKPPKTGVNDHIAARVRQLRAERGLSLDGLAERSGVSRSMISLIERAETSPTAVVLEKLAAALDTTLAGLFTIETLDSFQSDVHLHGRCVCRKA